MAFGRSIRRCVGGRPMWQSAAAAFVGALNMGARALAETYAIYGDALAAQEC